MSLPTYGRFYKDGKIVGIGFCNVGWFMNIQGLRRCIKASMDDAWDRYRPKEEVLEDIKTGDQYAEYFTTEDDLKNFEYIKIYEFHIPRKVALAVYFNKDADAVWEEYCKSIDTVAQSS